MTPTLPEARPEDIEAQREWEGQNIAAGIDRYRKSLLRREVRKDGAVHFKDADIGETEPGLKIIQDVMEPLVPAVEGARLEALDGLSERKPGGQPEWWWLIAWLPADKLALITLRTVLSVSPRDAIEGRAVTVTSNLIGSAIRDQLEFENWKRESRRLAKESDSIDLAAVLIARAKVVDRKTFWRWRKKCEAIQRLPWTDAERVAVGAKLLDLAIRHGNGWLELIDLTHGGKTHRRVRVTDAGMAALRNLNARLELRRPYLMPMTCPPQPWKRNGPQEPPVRGADLHGGR